MRILAIRGARLASLEAPFEIDLSVEPLRSAGVFAIVGPTGAGKSSLLDALCLALFDTTPRLGRSPRHRLDDDANDHTARDARTLVRRGAADAFAEVDFVGVDGRTHRARWSVDRARTGALRAPQLSVRELPSGRVIAGAKGEVLAAIESRLGLGMNELRRAVLLPQGEIAAFLDAPPDERALLLERLTGAEIFAEVSKVVHARAADARRAREHAEVALFALRTLDTDEIAGLDARVLGATLDAARAEEQVAALGARREAHAAVVRLRVEEREAREALAEVERQRALAELDRGHVELAERVESVADLLASEEGARRAENDIRTRLERAATCATEAKADIAPLEAERGAATDHANEVARVRAERVRGRNDERARLADSVRDASDAARAAGDAGAFHARQDAAGFVARALDRLEAAQTTAARATEAEDAATAARRVLDADVGRLDARALELALDATSQAARLDEATRAHERALAARSLSSRRSELVPGEACPLCGATEHVLAAFASIDTLAAESAARVASITLAVQRTRATLARVQATHAALRREAAAVVERAQGASVARVDAQREADLARRDAIAHAALVGDAIGIALEGGVAEARRALALVSGELATQAVAMDGARSTERGAHALLAALDAELRDEADRAHVAEGRAAARVERASRAYASAIERVRLHAETAQQARAEASAAALARHEAELAATRGLESAGLTRSEAARAVGLDRERLRRARVDLARLDRERASARARLEEREARRIAAEHATDDDGPVGEALDVAIDRMRTARDAARREVAAAEATLDHDRGTRARATELGQGAERARQDERRWAGLDGLIGAADGKRFRAHAQAITLERLVAFANAELASLAPRYLLSRAPAAGDLALVVIDREAGHARRSVQSLSGGESFLVALALALGLAAMTAAEGGRGSLRESSLFLDEGLGALDPDSLEIALAALDALRASGRQIAVVTHVPLVAERFAARVEVVPRGAGRSEVRVMRG